MLWFAVAFSLSFLQILVALGDIFGCISSILLYAFNPISLKRKTIIIQKEPALIFLIVGKSEDIEMKIALSQRHNPYEKHRAYDIYKLIGHIFTVDASWMHHFKNSALTII